MREETDSHQVMVLTPAKRETDALVEALRADGVEARRAADVNGLCDAIGRGIGAAVIASEILSPENADRLVSTLERVKHAAADPPLVILTDESGPEALYQATRAQIDAVATVANLERHPSKQTLISAVKFALRTRRQQFALRDEITQLEQIEGQLDLATSTLGEIVTEQTRTLRLLRDIATAANSAESTEEAFSFAISQVCRFARWSLGHAYLSSGDVLRALAPNEVLYEAEPGRFAEFRQAAATLTLLRGQGLPGRVYASGQPEWTSDIARDLSERRIDPGTVSGVAMAEAFPIMARTEVVGVLEFLSDDSADPEPDLLAAMASVGTLLGRVVERERSERALRNSVHLIQKIAETSPTMIRILDNRRRRYMYFNERSAQFFGLEVDDGPGPDLPAFTEAIHPDDWEHYRQASELVRQPGRVQPVTWQGRLRNATGEWRWLRTWSVVFSRTNDGEVKEILSISIDVTDEVETEERLRRTERLTSVGTLAAGIAHEINNPLASVIMTGQLLRRRSIDPEVDGMLDDLIRDAKRCASIVRNVQRFARQESSDRLPLNVNAVLRAAEEMCRTQVGRAGMKLTLDLASETPQVTGDVTELEQVVVNLVSNAVNASEKGAEILVTSKHADGQVYISVCDHGQGMTPDVMRRIFDPFYTTRAGSGGTGLGLSIVHGIIESHDGRIDVSSDVGHGTTVTVVLPAITPRSASEADE